MAKLEEEIFKYQCKVGDVAQMIDQSKSRHPRQEDEAETQN